MIKTTPNNAAELQRAYTFEDMVSFLLVPARTLILTHRNPDPDALGSSFALKLLLEAAGGEAVVACSDEPASRLSFIAEAQGSLQLGQWKYDRIVAVDTASKSQLGMLDGLADKVALSIDHHGVSQVFCPYYVDTSAPSASMIIYNIAAASGLELPREFYVYVYAAVSGDTGCFRYSNVLPETHLAAAEMLRKINVTDENGNAVMPDASEINRRIFDSHTTSELTAMQLVLSRLDVYCGGTVSVAVVTADELNEFGLTELDLADAANMVRSVEGVAIGVFARQMKDNPSRYHLSVRANVETDVSAVCSAFGGGGHKRASGCTINALSPDNAIDIILDAFAPLLDV